MTIEINTHGHPVPEQHGDWIDLCAAETVNFEYGEFNLISLGVSMKLPKGYYAEVVPRSSLFKNHGLIQANSIGIIDNDYCGDNDIWKFPAICLWENGTVIYEGDRICQFRLVMKQPSVQFKQVDSLNSADRGGFGSTGI